MKLIGDVAVYPLDDGKANAIDDAVLKRLTGFIDNADMVGAKALVITGNGRFFSAGLAVPSLIKLDRDGLRAFMNRFDEVMLALYAAPLPIVAAVNGHALAGGCVLALMADHRLMADRDVLIGLNEVRLSIGLPSSVLEPARALLPGASLTMLTMSGRSFNGPQARALGLIDEVCPAAELEAKSVAYAQSLAELPRGSYIHIKEAVRRPTLELIAQKREAVLESWLDTWFSDEGQRRLKALALKLEKPAKATKPA